MKSRLLLLKKKQQKTEARNFPAEETKEEGSTLFSHPYAERSPLELSKRHSEYGVHSRSESSLLNLVANTNFHAEWRGVGESLLPLQGTNANSSKTFLQLQRGLGGSVYSYFYSDTAGAGRQHDIGSSSAIHYFAESEGEAGARVHAADNANQLPVLRSGTNPHGQMATNVPTSKLFIPSRSTKDYTGDSSQATQQRK